MVTSSSSHSGNAKDSLEEAPKESNLGRGSCAEGGNECTPCTDILLGNLSASERRESESPSRSQALWSKQACSSAENKTRWRADTKRISGSGRQICFVGPKESVLSSEGPQTSARNAQSESSTDGKRRMGGPSSGKCNPLSRSVCGTGDHDEDDGGPAASIQEAGAARLDQDRRSNRSVASEEMEDAAMQAWVITKVLARLVQC